VVIFLKCSCKYKEIERETCNLGKASLIYVTVTLPEFNSESGSIIKRLIFAPEAACNNYTSYITYNTVSSPVRVDMHRRTKNLLSELNSIIFL
jgi:hypothetical protein